MAGFFFSQTLLFHRALRDSDLYLLCIDWARN
jgi:hypothetical protein